MSVKHTMLKAFFIGTLSAAIFCTGHTAYADELRNVKGSAAADGTVIDRFNYTDGSVYNNEAISLQTVKVGLCYNDEALQEAEFTNIHGGGFQLGYYDDNRNFVKTADLNTSSVLVSANSGGVWHILLNEEFSSEEKAKNSAMAYGGFVQEIDGVYRVLYGNYGDKAEAERVLTKFKLPGVLYTPDVGNLTVINSSDSTVLYATESGVGYLALVPAESENGLTGFLKEQYRGGFECLLKDGRISVVNYVGLEDYTKGVIPYEMSYAWPYEALKAQAVCARTYAVYNQDEYAEFGFDIRDDTYSQVYRGVLESNETSDSAVNDTAGQFVRYKGQLCEIYYFASDGGATEDGVNVFEADRPYLIGKPDPFEQAVDYSMRSWSKSYSGKDISWLLQNRGYVIGEVTEIQPEFSDTGNVIAINYTDADGNSLRIVGKDCYTSLKLNNCRFSVVQEDNTFGFYGSGWGHNCGMSQWGANAMASVYGYNYEDIIRFYFTGAYVA